MAKQFTFICVPESTVAPTTRLIRGTLREVESKLRGEWEIRRATVEEVHAMRDVDMEDAT